MGYLSEVKQCDCWSIVRPEICFKKMYLCFWQFVYIVIYQDVIKTNNTILKQMLIIKWCWFSRHFLWAQQNCNICTFYKSVNIGTLLFLYQIFSIWVIFIISLVFNLFMDLFFLSFSVCPGSHTSTYWTYYTVRDIEISFNK